MTYFSEKSLRHLLAGHGFAVLDVTRYVSERLRLGAPEPLRKISRRLVAGLRFTHSFSGRTLTVVARKTA